MRSLQQRLQSLERKAVEDAPKTELLLIGWEGVDFSKISRTLTAEEQSRGGVVFRWAEN